MTDIRKTYKLNEGNLTPLSQRIYSGPGILQQPASLCTPLNYQGISHANQTFDPHNTRAYVQRPPATPLGPIMRTQPILPQTH